jgi:hypothetical protein
MNKFTLGAVAGMASIALAIPVLAQVAGAQSVTSSVSSAGTTQSAPFSQGFWHKRTPPTQAQVQDMIKRDDTFLQNIDAMTAAHKTAMQAHKAALTAAAAITDDAQREAAVKKANDDLRTAMQAAAKSLGLDGKFMMGFGGPGHMGGKMGMRGHMGAKLAETLGMTKDELKTALDSGKTIEDLAKEKGVTLPARPMGGFGRGDKGPDNDGDQDDGAPATTNATTGN